MTSPFVVFALPRSRTYWLSAFLNYGGRTCAHDEILRVRGVDDVTAWLSQDRVGSVETAAAPFWRLPREIRPDVRIAVVRRPVADVARSLMNTGIQFDREALVRRLGRLDRRLNQIEQNLPDVVSVSYADLGREEGCARLFEHCLGETHNHAWWERLAPLNLQVNLAAQQEYLAAYASRLKLAEAACVRRIRFSLLGARVRRGSPDERGITIQEERAETLYRDGQDLFREHCAAVGEPEDEWTRKNIPMMFGLESAGAVQCVTARSNGRMLAYLTTIVGPSLESEERISATQTLFFSSRDALGLNLGESIQRVSINLLRARGVYEVIMREGVRGSGPKMNVLAKRLGFAPFGNLHRLQLRGA